MGRTALMYAASGPNPETVQLLLEKKADPNLVDQAEKFTALMFAAAEGQTRVVQILLKHARISVSWMQMAKPPWILQKTTAIQTS